MLSFALLFSFLFPVPLQAKVAQTPEQVIGDVQKFYEGTENYGALFRQTVINKGFGARKPADGKVFIQKPGKMRWDYYGPKTRTTDRRVTKSFISDGQTLWAVFHDDKQVYVKDLQKDLLPVAISFLTGKGDLRRDFSAVFDRRVNKDLEIGDKGDLVLKLTPKQPSAQYKNLWLVVDPDNYRVKQSLVVNSSDDINWIQFFEPKTDEVHKAGIFLFNAKKFPTYKVIDANKAAKGPAKE